MAIGREQATEIAIRFFTERGVTVVRTQEELASVGTDCVYLLSRVVYSGDNLEFDVRGPQEGQGWWVAFEELRREGAGWSPPDLHPSGGFVRVCEETGSVFRPSLL